MVATLGRVLPPTAVNDATATSGRDASSRRPPAVGCKPSLAHPRQAIEAPRADRRHDVGEAGRLIPVGDLDDALDELGRNRAVAEGAGPFASDGKELEPGADAFLALAAIEPPLRVLRAAPHV